MQTNMPKVAHVQMKMENLIFQDFFKNFKRFYKFSSIQFKCSISDIYKVLIQSIYEFRISNSVCLLIDWTDLSDLNFDFSVRFWPNDFHAQFFNVSNIDF